MAPSTTRRVPTREVTIRFFRAVRATTDGAWPEDGDVLAKMRRKLHQPHADPYIHVGDDSYIVEQHHDDPLHLSVSAVRRDHLPLQEHGGRTQPLRLPEGDNLAEQAHVVFFQSLVTGVVRSLAAPGHIRGSHVLGRRCNIDLALAPILRPEIEALIVNSLGVTKLDLRVAGNSFDATAANSGDPVETVRRMTSQFRGAGKAEIRLSATNEPDRQRFRAWLIRHLAGMSADSSVEMAKAQVIDRDGQRQMVNLLEDQIAITTKVEILSAARSLNPEAVRDAIILAFKEQQGNITRAIELHE